MNTPELLSDGNKLFQMKLANLQKTDLEFKPTAHLVEDIDKVSVTGKGLPKSCQHHIIYRLKDSRDAWP